MLNMGEIHQLLKKCIGHERYQHSLRVMKIGKSLAEVYPCDRDQVELAALLHDCGRLLDKEALLIKAHDFDIIQDDIVSRNTRLIHGPLGAELAKQIYHVDDRLVLNAIKYHTTGRPKMSRLEKIIYISDYIEPGRRFPGVDKLRILAYKDLNQGVLKAMEDTIKHIIDNGWLIHPDTINARNELIQNT